MVPPGAFYRAPTLCQQLYIPIAPGYKENVSQRERPAEGDTATKTGNCGHTESPILWSLSISVCHLTWLRQSLRNLFTIWLEGLHLHDRHPVCSVATGHKLLQFFMLWFLLWCFILSPTCCLPVPDFCFLMALLKDGSIPGL